MNMKDMKNEFESLALLIAIFVGVANVIFYIKAIVTGGELSYLSVSVLSALFVICWFLTVEDLTAFAKIARVMTAVVRIGIVTAVLSLILDYSAITISLSTLAISSAIVLLIYHCFELQRVYKMCTYVKPNFKRYVKYLPEEAATLLTSKARDEEGDITRISLEDISHIWNKLK